MIRRLIQIVCDGCREYCETEDSWAAEEVERVAMGRGWYVPDADHHYCPACKAAAKLATAAAAGRKAP